MTGKELILDAMRRSGLQAAQSLQARSAELSGTELNAEAMYLPDFTAACAKQNMLQRPVGFVCKSSAGRVVRLIQNYDSGIYPDEPENLPAQWGFVWSDDPAHALPFIALSTSPYDPGDCCIWDGAVYSSTVDGNVWPPADYPSGWQPVEE